MNHPAPKSSLATYQPLILVFTGIAIGTWLVQWYRGDFSAPALAASFMGVFFLAFSFFKLLDLKGFAHAFGNYDLIAKRSRSYGYVYPFIELGLGVAYVARWQLPLINVLTIVVMSVGALGVLNMLRQPTQIQCACLGAVIKLPLSKVTLFEDLMMVMMAGWMLLA